VLVFLCECTAHLSSKWFYFNYNLIFMTERTKEEEEEEEEEKDILVQLEASKQDMLYGLAD